MDWIGYFRRIMNAGAAETFDPTTDSLEAIANALGVGPSVGLWMFGIVDATQVASLVTVITNNLQNIPNDSLEGQFYMQVIYNASAPATAPEGEIRQITNFVQGGALQTLTTDAFSANVEAGDLVVIFHQSLLTTEIAARGTLDGSSATIPSDSTRVEGVDFFKGCIFMATEGATRFQPRPIRSSSAVGVFTLDEPLTVASGLVDYIIISAAYPVQRLHDIFNLVNAIETLTETGLILATDGTEQDVYINNAPAGVYRPIAVKINFTNQGAGETVVIRTRYRIVDGGALVLEEETIFAGVIAEPMKTIDLDPNRFGIQVTLEKTDAGASVNYECEVIYGA